jgi:transcriptional regulator with XRE-family HTH domain
MAMIHPIRRFRKENGLTQAQLGDRIGVNDVTISRWESFRREPDHDELIRIEAETGISIAEIVNARKATEAAQ